MPQSPLHALGARATEALVVVAAGTIVTAAVLALYRTIDPSFFVLNDARDASLPQGFEMARQLADGQLPVFTTRALSGGNHLVAFGSGPLHPLNVLIWSVSSVVGTATRVGHLMVFALGLHMYLGGYVLMRSTGQGPRLYSHLSGTLMVTAPMFLVFTLPGWWNNALGVGAYAWASAALILLRHRRTAARVVFLGLATYGVVASGWPHAIVAFAVTCTVVALPLAFTRTVPPHLRLRSITTLALPVIAGAALALPAISEFVTAGDAVARGGGLNNAANSLVPTVGTLAAVANPIAGDFLSAWGYSYFAIPFGFATLLVIVAACFTRHTAHVWRTDWVLRALTISTAVFYLATQSPAVLGPFRWPIRFLSFAVVGVIVTTLRYLAASERAWSRRRFAWAASTVVVGALYAAARVPSPAEAVRHARVLPLLLVVVGAALLALYAAPRLRRGIEAALVLTGILAVWAMPPLGWWNPGAELPDPAAAQRLAGHAEGGFLLDVHPHRDGWAPGLNSSRYLLAGISVVNGYDPVRHAGFAQIVRAADQGYLDAAALERLATSPADWPGRCWTDALRVSAVVTEADPTSGRHDLLEACGFHLVGVENNAALFAATRPFHDARSTVAMADPFITISGDELRTERTEVVTVANSSDLQAQVTFARLAWPGYRATLDGEPLNVTTVQGALVAVDVPAGARGVLTLTYAPRSWTAAWAVAGLGALGLALLAAAAGRADRRRCGPPSAGPRHVAMTHRVHAPLSSD